MTDRPATDTTTGTTAPARDSWSARRLRRHVARFVAAHGGAAEGQVAHLGARGFRLVLVGADGGWGDLVAGSREELVAACEATGVTLRDSFDGELAGRVRTGPYEWRRMAGMQLGGR